MISTIFWFCTSVISAVQEYTSYRSFALENKEVVWVQIYHEETPASDLSVKVFSHLKRNVWMKNVHYEGDDIVADLERYKVDYKRFGAKYMKTSNVIRTGRWDGKVRVSFKDGKYRVIVYGLHYVAIQPKRTAGKVSLEAHNISGTLSEFALEDFRTEFRRSRFPNLDLIHMNLKETFTLGTNQIIDQDW